MEIKPQYSYFEGQIVKAEEAVLPITTHALNYGTGIFEGIRAYYNPADNEYSVFRMADHYQRMAQSGKIMFMKLPLPVEGLCDITAELLRKNFTPEDVYIRPLLYKKDPTIKNFNLRTLNDGFAIYTVPMGRYLDVDAGIRVNTSSWVRNADNALPARAKITGSYVNPILAKTESALNGFDEAILLDQHGHAVEGTMENLFVVKDGVLITPPVSEDILHGITRDTVFQLSAEELGRIISQRGVDRSEIYQMDEIFLVGTGAEISPVIEVDHRPIGTGQVGELTKSLRGLYYSLVHGQLEGYENWITKVKP